MDNGTYKLFTGMINQWKTIENGLVQLFKLRPRNIFGGDSVTYDIVTRSRALPEFTDKNGGYQTVETDKFKNREYSPPAIKQRTNYSISTTDGRQAGTTVHDDIEKTAILMDKTSSDLAILLGRAELGMLWQASEIFQYGKIRFSSDKGDMFPDVDYVAPPLHFADVSTSWVAGGGTPIPDIEAHINLINKAGGVRVDNLIFGVNALSGFLQNTVVKETLNNRRIDRGNLSFETVQLNGFARIGVFNFSGVMVTIWTYGEYYDNVDAAGEVDGTTTDFIDPDFVVFYSSAGDYQRYFAGTNVIKKIDPALAGFLPSPNITIIEETVRAAVYIDTKEVSDGTSEGVYLRMNTRPLLVPRTNNTFGRLKVIL